MTQHENNDKVETISTEQFTALEMCIFPPTLQVHFERATMNSSQQTQRLKIETSTISSKSTMLVSIN